MNLPRCGMPFYIGVREGQGCGGPFLLAQDAHGHQLQDPEGLVVRSTVEAREVKEASVRAEGGRGLLSRFLFRCVLFNTRDQVANSAARGISCSTSSFTELSPGEHLPIIWLCKPGR